MGNINNIKVHVFANKDCIINISIVSPVPSGDDEVTLIRVKENDNTWWIWILLILIIIFMVYVAVRRT